jgi:formamidopyrimidine-DNA glycosylase
MPELPDVTIYVRALDERIAGRRLNRVRVSAPFLLKTADPPTSIVEGRTVRAVRRIGKRIAIGFEGHLWVVLHLMIAGRLHWKPPGAKLGSRSALAAFDFESGTLVLTEAGTKHRASLHVVRGDDALHALDPGGIDVFAADEDAFGAALTRENHTIKRALTDPRIVDGIGNAYSDEILHAAKLSPVTLTGKLQPEERQRLLEAARRTLSEWIDRLWSQAAGEFPEHVTAFHPEMAVHGRYGLPCPACGEKIQRIRYADSETNYCPRCQTAGKLLADRALSRLLGADRPRTLEELEYLKANRIAPRSAIPEK